jgi:hypothetical protein
MNVIFLSYWGINEGLSNATVLPHVTILSNHPEVDRVILVTIERGHFHAPDLPRRVTHVPLVSKHSRNVILTKINDFLDFPKQIISLCQKFDIDLLICRSSLAGAIGYLVWRKIKIPYTVESFEPHGSYMLESQVWRPWDPRYILQQYFESKQKKTAFHVLPVAENYAKMLLAEGVAKTKITTMPCCVDLNRFAFSSTHRKELREKLRIKPTAVVGIYVGKFGGMYYDDVAYKVFKHSQDFFGPAFYLIVLTDHDSVKLTSLLKNQGVDTNRVSIEQVTHEHVPQYLSASDFAFTFYKKSPAMKFLSPIKIGEYWANGLPILIEDGIGDDARIIANNDAGVICDFRNMQIDFARLQSFLNAGREVVAERIANIANEHRNFSRVENAYDQILRHTNSIMVTI